MFTLIPQILYVTCVRFLYSIRMNVIFILGFAHQVHRLHEWLMNVQTCSLKFHGQPLEYSLKSELKMWNFIEMGIS